MKARLHPGAARRLAGILIVANIAGCATPNSMTGSGQAAPAKPELQEGAVVVDGTPRELRERFALGLTGTAFSLQQPQAADDRLVVLYRGEPRAYIDCGQFVSVIKPGKGERRYEFPAASAFQRYEIMIGRQALPVERQVSIDASLTITLTPVAPARTAVAIDASYRATRQQTVRGGPNSFVTEATMAVSRREEAARDPRKECESTGRLEVEVLELLGYRVAARD